jgi:hypothetical protein
MNSLRRSLLSFLRTVRNCVFGGNSHPVRDVAAQAPADKVPAITSTTWTSNSRGPVLDAGCYSRIARELGVSRSHVCLVANGHRTSARVKAALEIERARVQRVLRKQLDVQDGGAQ